MLNYNIARNKKEDFFNFRNNSATFLDVFERFRLFICSVLALFSLFYRQYCSFVKSSGAAGLFAPSTVAQRLLPYRASAQHAVPKHA